MSSYGNRYNRADVVRLYVDEQRTVPEIAAALGCHRSAVYRHLDAAGVKRRDDRLSLPGRPRTERCVREHEWTPENTRIDGNGHRHCRRCDRVRALDRQVRAAIEELGEEPSLSR